MIPLKHSLTLWSEGGFHPHTIIPPGGVPGRSINMGAIGKQPAALADGSEFEWVALKWANVTGNDLPALERSMAAGANLGVRTGEPGGFSFVDCDFMDKKIGSAVLAILENILGGIGPVRVGQSPKWAMLVRASLPSRTWGFFKDGEKVGGVDWLSQGKQAVAQGIHPATLTPYMWSADPLGVDTPTPEIPEMTEEKLAELATALVAWGQSLGYLVKGFQSRATDAEGEEIFPEQASLAWQGSVAEFVALVAATPNPPTNGYDDWIKFGMAVKASLPQAPDMAFGAWLDWSLKWEPGPGHVPCAREDCVTKWLGFRGPFRVGAGFVALARPDAAARVIFAREPAELPQEVAVAALLDDTPPPGSVPRNKPLLSGDETAHLDDAQQAFARVVLPLGFGQMPPDDGHLVHQAVDYLARRLRGRVVRSLSSDDILFFEGELWHKLAVDRAAPVLALWGARYANVFFDGEGRPLAKVRDGLKTGIPGDTGRKSLRSLLPLEGVDDFDDDMSILNTPGGIVDLTTGKLRPQARTDRVSFKTQVTPKPGAHPLFDDLIASVTQGMGDFGREHVQLMCGSILLGNPQQRFWIVQGPGGNGKSTLADVIRMVLTCPGYAGYAKKAVRELLTKDETPKYALAPLKGARFIFFGEAPTGRTRLRADKIKIFAAHDQVTDRFAYAPDWLTFSMRCVPMLVANAPPLIDTDGGDTGVQRRMEFTAAPPDQPARTTHRDGEANADFAALVVKQEGAAVLAWMVEGALKVQAGGFVRGADATASRRMLLLDASLGTDPVGAWIAYFLRPTTALEETRENLLPVSALSGLMVAWAERHRPDDAAALAARMGDPARIGRALRQLGFTKNLDPRTRRSEIYAMQTAWAAGEDDDTAKVQQGWAMSASAWAEARELTPAPSNVTRIAR